MLNGRRIAILMLATSALTMPLPAAAQAVTVDDAAQLRAELAALKAQIAAIEARLGSASQAPAPAPPPVAAPPAPAKPSTEIGWKGAPELKHKDGWSFKPRGRLQLDAGTVEAPDGLTVVGQGFASRVRRVRLGFEGTVPGGFGYKIEADFAGSNVELADAHMTYTDGGTLITIGQHDNFQGLERVSSSTVGSFMERASFNEAFNFERKVGVSLTQEAGALLLQGGVFTDAISDLNANGNDAIGVDGRIVYAPKLGKAQFHLAMSGHWRDMPATQPETRYRSRPQIRTTDIRFVATGLLTVQQEQDFGVEAALISGPFHAAAEAHWLKASVPGIADPTFFGTSVEAGLFLTDDTRGYGKGVFRAIKVKNPVGQGGLGAWQINVRYDHLDLTDGVVAGGTQDAYMASLIWTPIDYVRFMVNYAKLDMRGAAVSIAGDRQYSIDTLGMRAQISF
jgi:phosphate-selective porin OprO and OprP